MKKIISALGMLLILTTLITATALATTQNSTNSITYQDGGTPPSPDPEFDPDKLLSGAGGSFVALDNPNFVSVAEATWMQADEVILGLEYEGEARAYPVRMLRYHHIVNDEINGWPVLVTF